MKKIDLVFRAIGERTCQISLDLALKNIQPHQVHFIENIQPFSAAVQKMLEIDYQADFIVFMDADCLILEDMTNFLQRNHFPYVDCYVLDKFRGHVHQGVHITRLDVVQLMQETEPPKNDEKYVLRPESRLRSFALQQMNAKKHFKSFRILHDHFQYYHHIYAKLSLRQLRSRTDQNHRQLDAARQYWAKHPQDLDFQIAQFALEETEKAVHREATPEEIDAYIQNLPKIAQKSISNLNLPQQTELTYEEVNQQAKKLWSWELVKLGGGSIEPPEEAKSPYKVFGIGLSRTGTKSLTSALHLLGLKVIHYPKDETICRELMEGHYQFSLLKYFDGITDIVVSAFYPQLDQLFPGSKFILTIRDKEEWLDSMQKHYDNKPAFDDESMMGREIEMKLRRFLRSTVYGCYEFNRDRMAYVYDLHYYNILNYFRDRPESLLILNITAGEGWEKLCPFLGYPPVDQPFPYVKKKSALEAMLNTEAKVIEQSAV